MLALLFLILMPNQNAVVIVQAEDIHIMLLIALCRWEHTHHVAHSIILNKSASGNALL